MVSLNSNRAVYKRFSFSNINKDLSTIKITQLTKTRPTTTMTRLSFKKFATLAVVAVFSLQTKSFVSGANVKGADFLGTLETRGNL